MIAFEPLEENLQLLRRSICLNPGFESRVTLFTEPLSAVVRFSRPLLLPWQFNSLARYCRLHCADCLLGLVCALCYGSKRLTAAAASCWRCCWLFGGEHLPVYYIRTCILIDDASFRPQPQICWRVRFSGQARSGCTLYSDNINVGDAHTSCGEDPPIPDGYSVRSRNARTATLDSYLAGSGNLLLLKMDVEGHEGQVTASRNCFS